MFLCYLKDISQRSEKNLAKLWPPCSGVGVIGLQQRGFEAQLTTQQRTTTTTEKQLQLQPAKASQLCNVRRNSFCTTVTGLHNYTKLGAANMCKDKEQAKVLLLSSSADPVSAEALLC